MGPSGYLGKAVSMENIQIGEFFGNHFRWVNLPDAQNNAYLLHFSDSLRADTTFTLSSVRVGEVVSLSGTVMETSDSIIDVWAAAGAFVSPVDREVAQATYHLNFLEVTRIKIPDAPPPGQDDGLGSG